MKQDGEAESEKFGFITVIEMLAEWVNVPSELLAVIMTLYCPDPTVVGIVILTVVVGD